MAMAVQPRRLVLRAGLILVVLAVVATALLAASDRLVSMPAVARQALEAKALGEFGDAHGFDRTAGLAQSHFSDCAALSMAGSGVAPGLPFSIRSRAVLWQPGTDMCEAMATGLRHPSSVAWFDYSRYWHGYRVVLFPLVEHFGYRGAQAVMGAVAMVAFAILALGLIGISGWAG